jgi:sulfonate transport system permease protein
MSSVITSYSAGLPDAPSAAAGNSATPEIQHSRPRDPVSHKIVRKSLIEKWLDASWSSFTAPALLIGLWSVATALEWMPEQILVSPLQVGHAAWELLESGELPEHLGISLYRLFAGFGLGSLAGIAFGILLGLSSSLRSYVDPTFNVLRQLPTVALIPLFILIFGIGETFKVFIVVKATFFIVALAVHDAIRNLSARYFEVASVYRFSRLQVVRRIVLPAITPATLTGIRIALSRSWMVLVGAELLAADSGLGQMMEMGRQMFRLDIVMVGVVLTGIIGFSLDRGFRWLESHLMRWKQA